MIIPIAVFRFGNVFPQYPVKLVKIERLCDITAKTKPAVFLVDIVIATGGDYGRVVIPLFDVPEYLPRLWSPVKR